MKKPASSEFADFYSRYVDAISNPFGELECQISLYVDYVEKNKDRLHYAYAQGKWSIREVIMHVVDTEIIFQNRLIRISRGDDTPMPGFDENSYVANTDYSHLGAEELKNIFTSVRKSTLAIASALSTKQYDLLATANGQAVSVRALLFIIPGHSLHHLNIFKERY